VFTTFSLFIVTVVASYLFYQRIKMAQSEYDKSRNIVKTITHSFNRQVKKIESNLEKVERDALEAKYLANEALASRQGNNEANLASIEKINELSMRVNVIEESIETMKKDLVKLASQPRPATSQTKVEAPIPVQKEDVLQGLTETELEVLRMIVDMGEGTVPEIKNTIGKTREHTARLLKKLYDKGFIDRNTSSMPYKYRIRKEIRDLIMEQANSTIGL